jgi:hypothetical protein
LFGPDLLEGAVGKFTAEVALALGHHGGSRRNASDNAAASESMATEWIQLARLILYLPS